MPDTEHIDRCIDRRPLFIFEMANNHNGSVSHGKQIIAALQSSARLFPEFTYAVKLQYRDKLSLLRPEIQSQNLPYLKRFTSTALSWEEYLELKQSIDDHGFLSVCTPWDEKSVQMAVEHRYDFLKIPSCYFSDRPLLEASISTGLPILASSGGANDLTVKLVASILAARKSKFAILHCVGEYPTADEHLNLSRIRYLRSILPGVEIGYSTHERPDNYTGVQIALALGATIFEKHVGLPSERSPLNLYSAHPGQITSWLLAAQRATQMLGTGAFVPIAGESKALVALNELRTALLKTEPQPQL